MAEAAIAPHVDDDVAVEFLAVFDRQLAGEGHGFGIVAIDVQDRRLDALGDIGRVGRGPRELRARGKADLVVDDEMQAAAGIVAAHPGKSEAFPHDALAGKGRIAVDQHGQHLVVPDFIIANRLLRAHLAQHHRIDRFQMRGVGHQAHMHLDLVERTIGAGAEMIFDVARSADLVGGRRTAGEFVEDHAIGFAHHIGEDVQPPAMGHAVDDLAHAVGAAIFDHRFQSGDHAFAAVEAETLGPDIFLGEEFLELFAADHGLQNRPLAFGRELDFLVLALELVLQEAALLDIGDMHVFDADATAIIGLQRRQQLADGHPFETEIAAEIDFLVLLAVEFMPFERQILGQLMRGQTQRIELGGKMPAHTIEPHQQHGAQGIAGGFLDRTRIGRLARLFERALHLDLHRGGIERLGQLVLALPANQRPALALPRRPGLGALRSEVVIFVAHDSDFRESQRKLGPRSGWRNAHTMCTCPARSSQSGFKVWIFSIFHARFQAFICRSNIRAWWRLSNRSNQTRRWQLYRLAKLETWPMRCCSMRLARS